MKAGTLRCGCIGLLLYAGPVLAHHSGAMFDREKTVTLDGTVKDFLYTNPHGWIDVLVMTDGSADPVEWSIETSAPQTLRRIGLTPSKVKPGDRVTLRAHPLKDGRPGGSFISVKLADGHEIDSGTSVHADVPEPAQTDAVSPDTPTQK